MEPALRDWLALQCQGIAGAEAGLLVLGASVNAPGAEVAAWPAPEHVTPRLAATLEIARERGQAVVQAPSAQADPSSATIHVALPVSRSGIIAGALAVAVRGATPTDAKSIAERLGFGLRALALILEAKEDRDRLAARLAAAGSLLDHETLGAAAHALAAELARGLGCERVAVGLLRRGRIRVVALSSSLRFEDQSNVVRDLAAAMEEALEQDAALELPAPPEAPARVLRAHAALARSTGAGAVCSVPLAACGRPVGALSFEWPDGPLIDSDRRAGVYDAGLLCGPILALMNRAEAGVVARARATITRLAERHFGAHHALAKGVLAASVALLVILAVVPAPYRISARATLEGRVQRALVAGVTGYIAEAHVRAGDLVAAGDVLATLDDRDLRLERRSRESQRGQLEKEYRQALAESDRAKVSILRAQIEQASARLGLVEEDLGRTRIIAPFAGIVLKGDLDHSLGSPVKQGDVLFELAPLDGYRIIVEVDGRDIADVAAGQTGRLALSALPGRTLPLVVERITPISTTRDGRTFFRAEASLEEPIDSLRPGMQGIAKIDAGRRRLLWISTHELFDWLRLSTWSLLP